MKRDAKGWFCQDPAIGPGRRQCSGCKVIQPLENFAKNRTKPLREEMSHEG